MRNKPNIYTVTFYALGQDLQKNDIPDIIDILPFVGDSTAGEGLDVVAGGEGDESADDGAGGDDGECLFEGVAGAFDAGELVGGEHAVSKLEFLNKKVLS